MNSSAEMFPAFFFSKFFQLFHRRDPRAHIKVAIRGIKSNQIIEDFHQRKKRALAALYLPSVL